MLLSSLGTSIANVALPTLATAFAASFQEVQWVVLAYLLATTSAIVSAGRLGDLVGRRRLLQVGLGLFTAASLVCGLAPALGLVIVARAAQGLGAAMMLALTLAFVSEVVSKQETGRAMGLLGTTSAVGTALGPSLGGLLVDALGWPAIFFINVPLGLAAMILVRRHLPADLPPGARHRVEFDSLGTLLLAATLAAYALAMTLGRGQFGARNLALLLAAIAGAGLFVAAQRRAASPLIRLALLREPTFAASLLANALVSTVLMATLVVGPFYLALALRLDASVVGIVLAIGPVVAALTGIPAGRAVDRLGPQRMALAGLGGIALGSLGLSVVPVSFGVPGYVAPILVITASYAVFQAANNTTVMRDVEPEQRGVVSGMLNLSRNLGLITGTALMGAVFALASGSDALTTAAPDAIAAGMRVTFAVAAGLITVALAIVTRARVWLVTTLMLMLALPRIVAAQEPTVQAPPAGNERGFVLRSADGANSLRILGLFQIQLAHEVVEGAPGAPALFVNRARVGLLGSVLLEQLQYMFVAELGGGEPRLLFLNLDLTLVQDRLTLRVGQFKRPFSRPFITFASQLSMIDRPLTVGPGVFGDDADLGVMLHDGGSGRFEYALGVFDGAGPGLPADGVHPLLAWRVGFNSHGVNPYSESDLDGGPPRVGIAAAGLVDLDVDGDDASFTSGLVDVVLKARGFTLSSAIYAGTRQAGRRWSDQRFSALGHHTQVGYVVVERLEPVVRYAFVLREGGDRQHDVAAGFNLFVRGHAFKWQNFASVRLGPGDALDLLVQSQLSLSF